MNSSNNFNKELRFVCAVGLVSVNVDGKILVGLHVSGGIGLRRSMRVGMFGCLVDRPTGCGALKTNLDLVFSVKFLTGNVGWSSYDGGERK